MIATILIVFGAITGALGLADILGGDPWRKKMSDWTILAWNKLDNAKKDSILRWLLKSRVGNVIGVLALAIIVFGSLYLASRVWYVGTIAPAVIIVLAILGALAGRYGVALLLHPNRTTEVMQLVAFVVVLTALVWYGTIFIAYITEPPFRPMAANVGHALFVYSFVTGAAVFWAVGVLPTTLVLASMGVLWIAELLTRRIAESPKGVVMALAGVITAVGAVLKAFE
jgi:hypothetical protein